MATVVFMRQTRQAGLTGFFNNDPVAIVEDGQEVGTQVDPAINPASIFQIVDVPGVPKIDIQDTLQIVYGTEVQGNRLAIQKRLYTMNVNQLPVSLRSQYTQGDRISLTEVEYNTAVLIKPGSP